MKPGCLSVWLGHRSAEQLRQEAVRRGAAGNEDGALLFALLSAHRDHLLKDLCRAAACEPFPRPSTFFPWEGIRPSRDPWRAG